MKIGGEIWFICHFQNRKGSEEKDGKLLAGGFCAYHNDSQTSRAIQTLPLEYRDGLVKIKNIETFDKAEHDEFGWCIKGAFRDFDNRIKNLMSHRHHRH